MRTFSLILSGMILVMFWGCEVRSPIQIGARFPQIALENLEGKPFVPFEGKALVVRFWQSHCASCVREMPFLDKLYEKHYQKLDIIAINVGEPKETLLSFAQKHKLHHELIADEEQKLSKTFGIVAIPTTLFINRAGIITDIIYGESSPLELEKRLQNIIN